MTLACFALFAFSSCDEYLDVEPNKSTSVVPSTVDELDYLLNGYESGTSFAIEYNYAAFAASDSFGLYPELEAAVANAHAYNSVLFAVWDAETIADSVDDLFFSGEYKKIFTANMVLYYLDSVSGSEELKEQLRLEAKFIRAYSLWQLTQVYCLHYDNDNKDTMGSELGVTIKTSTSFEDLQARSTLDETYAQIEADLIEALAIDYDMPVVNDMNRCWRASKAAVNGFAARFYLGLADYDKALTYAKAALESHSDLVDYNTEMYYTSAYSDSYYTKIIDGVEYFLLYPYTFDGPTTDRLGWKETLYYRFVSDRSWWYLPSEELLAAYDQENDLRFTYHFIEDNSIARTSAVAGYYGYIAMYYYIISGPTTAEMLLIKAEAEARNGSVDTAMATVNELRAARMLSTASDSEKYLSASSATEAVNKIIEERWREMPFTLRWFDCRRLNHNADSSDDIGTITRSFQTYTSSAVISSSEPVTYTLEPGSRYYAFPMSQEEINSSVGVIQQNIY